MSRTSLTKKKAQKKGLKTAGAVGATVLLAYVWWPLMLVGLGATAYYGYDWLKFRGTYGMKF